MRRRGIASPLIYAPTKKAAPNVFILGSSVIATPLPGTLRATLSGYLDVRPEELRFSNGEQNKPRLARAFRGKGFGFNLSHSYDLAIYAVGYSRNIGIDVERIPTTFRVEDIAQHYFSPGEFRSLMRIPSEQRAEGFFACWTRKEAYIKARGGACIFRSIEST